MSGRRVRSAPGWAWAIVIVSVAAAALAFMAFFESLPIEGTTLAIDWQSIYPGIQGGRLSYAAAPGLRNPPWPLLPLLPLGLLSLRASWGLLNLLTLAVLVISVPRHRDRLRFVGGVLLLAISYPALRHAADGNLEGLVIGGTLLLLAGYSRRSPGLVAAGVLLVTVKPQVSFMLLTALAVLILRTWPARQWAQAAALVVLVAGVTLLLAGTDNVLDNMLGIEQRGSIMDSSLWAATTRAGLPAALRIGLWLAVLAVTLAVIWRGGRSLSRIKAGHLMAASLLLAPYAAGNTILSVLAIGVIPYFQARPRIGLVLIALLNLPLLIPAAALRPVLAWYVTGLLLLIWAVLGGWVWREERAPA